MMENHSLIFQLTIFIDEFVATKLRKLNVRPSALSSDAEFMRRVLSGYSRAVTNIG